MHWRCGSNGRRTSSWSRFPAATSSRRRRHDTSRKLSGRSSAPSPERPTRLQFFYHWPPHHLDSGMAQETSSSLRTALQPSALREALAPRRPVFSNPWDSTEDAFACYLAVSVVDPLLLWVG